MEERVGLGKNSWFELEGGGVGRPFSKQADEWQRDEEARPDSLGNLKDWNLVLSASDTWLEGCF